jgi:4-aminobutyrate aminotransferase-like enzyme
MSDVPRIITPLPGPRSRALLERQDRVLYPGLTHGGFPFVVDRKVGWTVEDVDGNVFADLASASASVPFGAAPPEIVAAATAALARYGSEDTHALTTALVAPLAEQLVALAPPSLTRVDIALNGTEAIETAIRVMRRATGRPIIVGFHSGYHGESSVTAALGAEHHEIAAGARSLVPGFTHVPYPHPYRSPFAAPRPGGSGDATVDYLRDHVLFHTVDPREVAGVVIEPIVGSGGVLEPPAAFWPALRALCDEFGWLLCLDEVKTGFGRTGTLFAAQRWDLRPDLMCVGKAMGGGVMPIGAVLGSELVLGGFDDLSTGSTWSWLPASCAAALATIERFADGAVLANVRELERVAIDVLGSLPQRFSRIGDVRVVGAFIALELVADPVSRERAPELQEALAVALLERGVLGDSSTTSLNLQPSLVMEPEELRRILGIVVETVAAVVG